MSYRGYADHLRAWEALASFGARVRRLGPSAQGEPLVSIAIGPSDAERACVVLAGMHAMEWIGVEACSALCSRLAARAPSTLVVAFPLVNVDGFRSVEEDRRLGRRRFRRGNARGVDLNRNWPTFFRARSLASMIAPRVWHPGPSPGSEPEIAAITAELEDLAARTRITRALSLHSYGNAILYPYGGRWQKPARLDALRRTALDLASRLGERYAVHQVARWHPGAFAYGMEIDHLYEAYGADALLVEIGKSGLARATLFDPWRWFNPPDLQEALAQTVPALEAFVRDA